MIVLALLEITEPVACDLAVEAAQAGVPVRQRTRRLVEWAIRERAETITVRWATLAHRDREELERRRR